MEHFLGQVKILVQGNSGVMLELAFIEVNGGSVLWSLCTTCGAGLLTEANVDSGIFLYEVIEGDPELASLYL